MFIAGDQVPVIPLFDVVSSSLKVSPLQIGFTALKEGVIIGFTTMSILDVIAHCPASGKKVYIVVALLLIAGDQVPVTPLFDVVGNAKKSPLQIGST